ncbi:MAG: hypothetical protein H6628_18060 [Calditrichae bacterium]|nr:hypothetical protein [Calditrichia bacterium]
MLFKKFFPLIFSYFALIVAAILLDYLLHLFGFPGVGRYLGIAGTLLILLSFLYSLRKRRLIEAGSPRGMLALHEYLAWAGAMMILVHSGIHFQALLPWLAAGAMMLVVASGHIGKFLLRRSREALRNKQQTLAAGGLSEEEIEKQLFWDALTLRLMTQWRMVHIPFVMVFVTLAILHILSIFFFWNWK